MKKKTLKNLVMSFGLLCFLGFSFLYMNQINVVNEVTDFLGPQQKKVSSPGFQYAIYGDEKANTVLQYPVSVLSYEKGVYIVDQDAGNVKVFDQNGKLAGVFGRMKSPYGIAEYGDNFYISDIEIGEIIIFSKSGKRLGNLKIKNQKQKVVPGSLLNDSKYLYVADVYQGRVLVYNLPERKLVRTMGSFGTGKGQLKYPHGMAVDNEGNLYVADSGNNRIVVFDNKGQYMNTIGGAPDKVGGITTVRGLAIDAKGNLFATASLIGTVQVFTRDGEALYSFGGSGQEEGLLGLPNEICVDAAGRLYITELKNKRVSVFQK